MTGSRLIVVFVSVLTGLVLAVMPVSAQTTNIDMSNDTKLLMRQMEMEASMKSIEESSRKESASSKDEYLQSVEILQQTLDRFFDCAPGLTTRMKEWMTIRASIEVAGKTIFKNGNDSIYKNLTKMMNRRMFTLPDAATMPGDMVWRRYKDAFIRTEKAFLGTSRIEGCLILYKRYSIRFTMRFQICRITLIRDIFHHHMNCDNRKARFIDTCASPQQFHKRQRILSSRQSDKDFVSFFYQSILHHSFIKPPFNAANGFLFFRKLCHIFKNRLQK